MKTKRLVVAVFSVVAALCLAVYGLSKVMAEPRHNPDPPIDDNGSFTDNGTPDFSAPPIERPAAQGPKKEHPKGKGGSGGVVEIASDDPDLVAVGVTLTPQGGALGDNGLPNQPANLTVEIKNDSSIAASNFTLSVWFARPPGQGPPLTIPSDASTLVQSLGSFQAMTVTFPFTLPPSPEAYRPWAFVDSGSVVTEIREDNNVKSGLYGVMEIATLLPRRVLIPVGGSVTFQAISRPSGTGMTWPPGTPATSLAGGGPGTLDAVIKNSTGNASFTFFSDGVSTGVAQGTLTCGAQFERFFVEVRQPGLIGPADVPGLTRYNYFILTPVGTTPTDIVWSVVGNPAEAFVRGATNMQTAEVEFKNTNPAVVTVKVDYKVNGVPDSKQLDVAIVRVQIFNPASTTPGTAASGPIGANSCLVADSPEKMWVTKHDPGSDWNQFKYKGTYKPHEPRVGVATGVGGSAWTASAGMTLTAPADRASAIGTLQVGFIQTVNSTDVKAVYTLANLKRTGKRPAVMGLDWLSSLDGPQPGNEWPWYPGSSKHPVTPVGTLGWWDTISMSDSPVYALPAQWNPTDMADPNRNQPISSGTYTDNFSVRMVVRTKDDRNAADTGYFQYSSATFVVRVVYPPKVPAESVVTKPAIWQITGGPLRLSINDVTPALILFTSNDRAYHMWIPSAGP